MTVLKSPELVEEQGPSQAPDWLKALAMHFAGDKSGIMGAQPMAGPAMGIVRGPGAAMMKERIPERLYQFLDKTPLKLFVDALRKPNANLPAAFYKPLSPEASGGHFGGIWIQPEHVRTGSTWTHEAMHAANDLSGIQRAQRTGASPNMAYWAPDRGYVPKNFAESPLYTRATKDPSIRGYEELYRAGIPNLTNDIYKLEAINEWMARNAQLSDMLRRWRGHLTPQQVQRLKGR